MNTSGWYTYTVQYNTLRNLKFITLPHGLKWNVLYEEWQISVISTEVVISILYCTGIYRIYCWKPYNYIILYRTTVSIVLFWYIEKEIWWHLRLYISDIAAGGSSGGLISKVLLANADALCAAASPLMDLDDSSL